MKHLLNQLRLYIYAFRNAILRYARRLGIASDPARFGLDTKIAAYLPERGFFIEAGANDGYSESNTYGLQKKGWNGILIEPIPTLYAQCVKERSGAHLFNCALVSSEDTRDVVTMHYGNLMSFIEGALSPHEAEKHLAKAAHFFGDSYTVAVPARTLTSILDEIHPPSIDFLSLDIEGYEAEALKGLDFSKYRPTYMLIEHRDVARRIAVEQTINPYYALLEQLTPKDYLYKVL